MQRPTRILPIVLSVLAIVIVVLAVVLVMLPQQLKVDKPRLAEATALLIALGSAGLLFGVAALVRRGNQVPPEVHAGLARIQQQLVDAHAKLGKLSLSVEQLGGQRHPTSEGTGRDYSDQLSDLSRAIAEVKELSLLPDSERRRQVDLHRQARKNAMVKDLFGLVAARHWSQAERLLITLETEFPNDGEVAKGRSHLNHSRALVEEETMAGAVREAEDLMAGGFWDRAIQRCNQLVQGFPTSADGHALLARVKREYDIHRESAGTRLFDEIRQQIENRAWRNACTRAKELLDKYPDHRSADRIRDQFPTLRDNAEIEQRQEMEIRIQTLIHDGQLDQAIDLGEELIRQFPDSPQAESLETLLPRIRELARKRNAEIHNAGSESSGAPHAGGSI